MYCQYPIEEVYEKEIHHSVVRGERRNLTDLVRKGKVAAYRRTHAQILLLTDEGDQGPGLQDKEVAERVGVNHRTVSRLRERCVERGA